MKELRPDRSAARTAVAANHARAVGAPRGRGAWCALLLIVVLACIGWAQAQVVLDDRRHHLGIAGRPEWSEFAATAPEGGRLEVSFRGHDNPREATILFRQDNVKLDWPVRLNGRDVGRLLPMEARLWHALAIPPGVLRDGDNRLSVDSPGQVDDIVIDRIVLDPRPLGQSVGQAALDVSVTDGGGAPLPCRITITDREGTLTPLLVEPGSGLAARAGVVYSPSGHARIRLQSGEAIVYASRGFEYGVASQTIRIAAGQSHALALSIRREVPTPGMVACDTHVHTLTHSGHGDASVDERVVTLAGEGIELPIATDHDFFTDLGPAGERLGVRPYFTPVVGDEVTTRQGHFNAFPFAAGSRVPDSGITDWPSLLRSIRGESGPAQAVVILNHPRDLHAGFRPFDPAQFNPVTGAHTRGAIGVDAIEVINSVHLQSDPMRLLRDWMVVLNHGERITAVGASDSHDVARYIVGQGRTFIVCRDEDPARIDVLEAIRALRAGRAVVSLGLLIDVRVDGRFHVGDLATGTQPVLRVQATVLGPSWSRADRVALFANGARAARAADRCRSRHRDRDQARGDVGNPATRVRHPPGGGRLGTRCCGTVLGDSPPVSADLDDLDAASPERGQSDLRRRRRRWRMDEPEAICPARARACGRRRRSARAARSRLLTRPSLPRPPGCATRPDATSGRRSSPDALQTATEPVRRGFAAFASVLPAPQPAEP